MPQTQQAPPAPAVPFTSAAHEHTEPMFDVTVTPTTTVQNIGPFDVPAYGYMRHLVLEVTSSGGALGGGALNADYPFNVFSSLSLNDVNGAPIFGPLDGFAAMLTNRWGAYAYQSDPRLGVFYDGTIVTGSFLLRIPVEISHKDGFGALANQNAAASYKFSASINTLANLVTGGAPTAPAVRIRGYLEAWSLPNETDPIGRPQAMFPPVHGTTQFWSQNIRSISAGANTTPIVRVGNLLRSLVIVSRNASGVRANNVFPDPAQLLWDARSLLQDSQNVLRQRQFERINNGGAAATGDAGVFVYGFNHSEKNSVGDDSPTLWLPTVQATRLEIQGTSAAAGTLQVLTNDVAPAEVIPQERFVETSETGFHPAGVNSTAQ